MTAGRNVRLTRRGQQRRRKVFKYALTGTLLGSWTIDAANSSPTGITLDPSNVQHLWIVDNGTDKVYQYDNATTRTSGSQSASASFALADGNTNPQGIADPAVSSVPSSAAPVPASSLQVGAPLVRGEALAEYGWFVDPTPWDDSEFTTPGNQGEQHRMDLLTVLEHELGHVLGFDHQETGVMEDTLATGTRKTPTGQWTVQDWALLALVFAGEQKPLRRRFF